MESFEFNLADGFDRDEFFGNLKLPPQKLVLSLPDGTKVEMVNESQLREQIAGEIEADERFIELKSVNDGYLFRPNQEVRAHYANLVRGKE